MRIVLFFLCFVSFCFAAPKHKRDGTTLPRKEREFAEQLSIKQRKIFAGRFSHAQRELTIRYARGRGKDSCLTPDEAVLRVMEETGMSLAVKGRPDVE